jgi:hypothetical protein
LPLHRAPGNGFAHLTGHHLRHLFRALAQRCTEIAQLLRPVGDAFVAPLAKPASASAIACSTSSCVAHGYAARVSPVAGLTDRHVWQMNNHDYLHAIQLIHCGPLCYFLKMNNTNHLIHESRMLWT